MPQLRHLHTELLSDGHLCIWSNRVLFHSRVTQRSLHCSCSPEILAGLARLGASQHLAREVSQEKSSIPTCCMASTFFVVVLCNSNMLLHAFICVVQGARMAMSAVDVPAHKLLATISRQHQVFVLHDIDCVHPLGQAQSPKPSKTVSGPTGRFRK